MSEGVPERETPPGERDLRDGFAAARKFIRSKGGTALKTPKAVITPAILKKTAERAQERRLQARARRDAERG